MPWGKPNKPRWKWTWKWTWTAGDVLTIVLNLAAAVAFSTLPQWLAAPAKKYVGEPLSAALDFIVAHGGVISGQIAIAAGTLVVGTGFYIFRCRALRWYGSFEILVGIAGAAYFINAAMKTRDAALAPATTPPASPELAVLYATYALSEAAALYVIVRGYDNCYKALADDDPRKRRWNKRFFGKDVPGKLA